MKGLKGITSEQLSAVMGVGQRDFEQWANNHPMIYSYHGKNREDIVYYSLKRIESSTKKEQELKMSKDSNSKKANEKDSKESVQIDIDKVEIGSEEFNTFVAQLLNSKKTPWRSIEAISTAVKKDVEEVRKWADNNVDLVRRPSKDKDKIYYCLASRFSSVVNSDQKAKSSFKNHGVTLQEYLAFARLHEMAGSLVSNMDFYANRIATRHEEAFAHLTKAQKELCSAVSIMQKELKIRDTSLPSFDYI
jgi:hypothetical protein